MKAKNFGHLVVQLHSFEIQRNPQLNEMKVTTLPLNIKLFFFPSFIFKIKYSEE